MHYHLEILMPPTADVEAAIEAILAPFSENNEESRHAFWDWYQLGGRYSGAKLEALVSQEKRDAFYEALKGLNVTVSGLRFGKQELSPATQAPAVDALWREMCPGAGDVCPLFKHSGDAMSMDVCRLDEVPADLKAYAFIHAAHGYGEKIEAQTMLHKSIWNGVTHQDTTWGGNVKEAIAKSIKECDGYREDYKAKIQPQPDWLMVTVDYHS